MQDFEGRRCFMALERPSQRLKIRNQKTEKKKIHVG
jgi:hypothetical protein